jgi:hypothetical protein
MEVQIVTESGEILRGEELMSTWKAIFDKIEPNFERARQALVPSIQAKIAAARRVTKTKSGKQLPYLEIEYETMGKTFPINVIGPDPNISQVTWIMELVTPPCLTLAEYAAWNALLNQVLVDSLPEGYRVLPLGLNPVEEEYLSGVTFGEHYHVGTFPEDLDLKLAAYNLIRDFIPQLIALTVNSPFINKRPTGTVKIVVDGDLTQILTKDCTKSLRLFYNKAQMGPVDKETYIPYLDALDHDAFCEAIRRKPPDDRFVDVNPFTPYGTIEIRVFDTQFSVARRVAIVALIEALCLKAKRLLEQDTKIPNVMAAVLVANREKAVTFGLHGKFTPDTLLPGAFAELYNEDPNTGKQNGKLFQAVTSMFYFLKKEIKDLTIEECLLPFHMACAGTEMVKPPLAPADYLLFCYGRNGEDFDRAFSTIRNLQQEYCTSKSDAQADPVLETWGIPSTDMFPKASSQQTEGQATVVRQDRQKDINYEIEGVNLNVDPEAFERAKPIPFTLQFTITTAESSNVPIDILVIQQLIETQKKSEIVLASAFKKIAATPNAITTLTQSDVPLKPNEGIFIGKKQCRLKFVIKGKTEQDVYSSAFWLELVPRFSISSEFRKKKIQASEHYDIKYRIYSGGTSSLEKAVTFQAKFTVVSGDGNDVLHQEVIVVSIKNEETISFKFPGKVAGNEQEVSLRLLLSLNDKVIARHEIIDLPVEVAAMKPESSAFKGLAVKKDEQDSRKARRPATSQPSRAPQQEPKPALARDIVRRLEFSKSKAQEPVKGAKRAPAKQSSRTPKKKVPTTGSGAKPAAKPQGKPGAKAAGKTPSQKMKEPKPTATATLPKLPTVRATKVATVAGKAPKQPAKAPAKRAPSPAISKPMPASNLNLPQSKKREQERIAKLLAATGVQKEEQAVPADIPFVRFVHPYSFKLDIDVALQSGRILTPGVKISAKFSLRRAKTLPDGEIIKIIVFFVNGKQDIAVIDTAKVKIGGDVTTYQVQVDAGKVFKSWQPTTTVHLVLLAFHGNELVGQSIYSGFDVAHFTTSDQITWKKIDLISGTIYPGMDAALDLDLDLKGIVNPVLLRFEMGCQNMKVGGEITIYSSGSNRLYLPFRIPDGGLIPVQNAPFFIKIFDASGMMIREQKKLVSIIPSGPLFDIKDLEIDASNGFDSTYIQFVLVNDGKADLTCQASLLAHAPAGQKIAEICSKRVKVMGNREAPVQFEKVFLPLHAVASGTLSLDILVEIQDFNKICNLIHRDIDYANMVADPVMPLFSGAIQNLTMTPEGPKVEISSQEEQISLEIDVQKNFRARSCKVKLVQREIGGDAVDVKIVKLPAGIENVRESFYWKPPRARNVPTLCRLDLVFTHDEMVVEGTCISCQPLFFVIYPET